MNNSLKGIKVLDLTRVLAGPYCTQMLGDLGADIIKVERPGGGDDTRGFAPPFVKNDDGEETDLSAYFCGANRNKRSITINLSTKEGQGLVKKLLSECDILVENFKTGTLEKYGLGYNNLKSDFPKLIYCSISGFGDEGPYKNQKAYDMLIQAETGVIDITGLPDKEGFDGRAKVGPSVCDISAGMTAYQAILQAIIKRSITGEGRHISVSMFNSLADWMNPFYLGYVYNQKVPKRNGMTHPIIVPYGAYACKDKLTILIAIPVSYTHLRAHETDS